MGTPHPHVIKAVKCPKCGHVSNDHQSCPSCGIDFAGYDRYLTHHQAAGTTAIPQSFPGGTSTDLPPTLGFISSVSSLFVQQNEDALRIFTGWQTRNHYVIVGAAGETLAYLAERDTSFWRTLSRLFLRQVRPFTFDFADSSGQSILRLERPFAWFFPRLEVIDPSSGQRMGSIQKRFALIRNFHELRDALDVPLGSLRSSLWGGRTIGDAILGNQVYRLSDASGNDTGAFISRRWNGMLNRLFTDKDTFYVEFAPTLPPLTNLLLLCASICIDFESYEKEDGPAKRFGLLGSLTSTLYRNLPRNSGDI